ncbi:MAG: hypothetical protein RSB42_09390, partial [Comamonas sp.]
MSTISPTLSSVLTSQAMRSTSTAAKVSAPDAAESVASTPSTVLSLDTMTAVDVIYTKPAPYTPRQAWASQTRDAVSSLMATNSARSSTEGLAGRWRGL